MEKSLEQIKAVMLGHAVGDALGVPVEFCEREELDENPVTDMMGWGSYPVPEGCWSDDTSMALATLDSLKNGKIDYDEIMENFIAWCTRDEYTPTGEMFDIGKTCMTAIRNYLATDGKPALECGLTDERSNGNGSLMRIHPMALYLYYKGVPREEAIEIIHNTSAITHAHPRSKVACGIYSCILWELMDKHNKYAVFMGLNKARKYYNLRVDDEEKRWIRKILSYPELSIYERNQLLELLWLGIDVKETKGVSADCTEDDCFANNLLIKRLARMYYDQNCIGKYKPVTREEISSTGYVVDTLEAAIWCILTTYSYKECVLKAVKLGGDTDTIAAIAGGLAGALYGLDSIPREWLDALKKREYIEEMCESACSVWIGNPLL